MRMRIRLALAGLVAATLLGGTARADRIFLRDGDSIEGWIVDEKPDRIVVKVIQGTSVGKVTIDPAQVQRIDRTRTETLEEALARVKRERAERPPAPPAAPPASPGAARPGMGAGESPKGVGAAKPGAGQGTPKKTAAELIPRATPEQEVEIEAQVERLGDVRRVGGAAGRRESAIAALSAMGAVVIPYVTRALDDTGSWRSANAARVLRSVALTENHIEAYVDALPKLVALLQDRSENFGQYVRADAAAALREITGEKIDWPEAGDAATATDPTAATAATELSPAEVATLAKWTAWWAAYQQSVKAQKVPGSPAADERR